MNIPHLKYIAIFGGFLFTIIFIQACGAPAAEASSQKWETLSQAVRSIPACKDVKDKILNYTSGNLDSIKRGAPLLLEKNLDVKYDAVKKAIKTLKIDGNSTDWEKANFLHDDIVYDDIETIDEEKPIETPVGSDDLQRFGFVMDSKNIYVELEPRDMPEAGKKYRYSINFYTFDVLKHTQLTYYKYREPANKVAIFLSIVWTDSGSFVQQWDPLTGKFVKDLNVGTFVKGNVFEAQVPVASFKNLLPYQFYVAGASRSEDKNLYDETPRYIEQTIGEKFKKTALELLCRYAAQIDLNADDPLPLTQALTDAYIYKVADPSTQDAIVKDGIGMTDIGRKAATQYTFAGQKALKELPLEAIWVWSNRLITHGGHPDVGMIFDKNGRLNEATYKFVAVTPDTLNKALEIVKKNNLYDAKNLQNTVNKTEKFITETQKYRADLDFISWAMGAEGQVYHDALAEEDAGDIYVGEVNGRKILKYKDWSASFNIDYLYKNGKTFGNCVDVAAITAAIYKAMGVPAIIIRYSSISDEAPTYYSTIHTFSNYYSSKEDKWFNYKRGGNPIYEWAKREGTVSYQVASEVVLPQVGSFFGPFYRIRGGADWNFSQRTYAFEVSQSEWKTINEKGYPMADLVKAMGL